MRLLVRVNASHLVPSSEMSPRPFAKPDSASKAARNGASSVADSKGTLLDWMMSTPLIATPPFVAALIPLVIGPVGSNEITAAASRTPDKTLYGIDLGLNTRFAAARPTVHAEPLIVPRYSRAFLP